MNTQPIRITARRLQIVKLRADGNGVKATAKILHIEPSTVNSHCDAILYSTNSSTFTQAVYKLTKQGLITILLMALLAAVFNSESSPRARRVARRSGTRQEIAGIEFEDYDEYEFIAWSEMLEALSSHA